MKPSRLGEVDGLRVGVFDDALPEFENARSYVGLTSDSRYRRSEFARRETRHFKHWVTEFELPGFAETAIGRASTEAVASLFPDRSLKILRSSCNVATYGDMLFRHSDGPRDRGDVTCLWFICDEWRPDWGGEILLFDEGGDARFVVSPRPGRCCVFEGAILHAGTTPTRLCYKPRFTVALRFVPRAVPEGRRDARSAAGVAAAVDVAAIFESRLTASARTFVPAEPFTCKCVVAGARGGSWRLRADMTGVTVLPGDGEFDSLLILGDGDLGAILRGELDLASAIVQGRVKISGSVEQIMDVWSLIDQAAAAGP